MLAMAQMLAVNSNAGSWKSVAVDEPGGVNSKRDERADPFYRTQIPWHSSDVNAASESTDRFSVSRLRNLTSSKSKLTMC